MSGTRSERVRATRVSSECVRGDRVRVLIVDDEPALTELLAVADGHSGPHAVAFDGGGNLVEVYISSVSDQLRDPTSDVVSGGGSVHRGGVA
ncbi:hypothetical protein SAMN02787118_11374 [Streptomyces mirabilis]|jgi:hypothetical protein|uniref:Uncharacterized protein n=1 Tax=Streptomyces mirabilis TaxID=68239 RepID=A0A1I2MEP3_9ACTN|nr:hypothetical protein SAMN02787118_11374 [Streptomyces mirabilis]